MVKKHVNYFIKIKHNIEKTWLIQSLRWFIENFSIESHVPRLKYHRKSKLILEIYNNKIL